MNIEYLVSILKKLGLKKGDVVYCSSNIGIFATTSLGFNKKKICKLIFDSIFKVIGTNGMLVVPTFTYSFCNNEIFDIRKTPSKVGIFSEYIRKLPNSNRSKDPIFSVAAVGKKSKSLISKLSISCFGKNSVWERLLKCNAFILNLNVDGSIAPYIHYFEKINNCKFRFDKKFYGKIKIGKETLNAQAIYYVRDLNNKYSLAYHKAVMDDAYKIKKAKKINIKSGFVYGIRFQDSYKTFLRRIKNEPFFVTLGGKKISKILKKYFTNEKLKNLSNYQKLFEKLNKVFHLNFTTLKKEKNSLKNLKKEIIRKIQLKYFNY